MRAERSDLGETAVDKQFRAGDVACVVGRKKRHSICHFIGRTEPAEWDGIGNQFLAFLAHGGGRQQFT